MSNRVLRAAINVEKLRYIANGVIATSIHYISLRSALYAYPTLDVGVANLLASVVGISSSFIGNRYFVFSSFTGKIRKQFFKFVMLYTVLACCQGVGMHGLVEWVKFDIAPAFLMCTLFQFVAGYLANKYFVFHE